VYARGVLREPTLLILAALAPEPLHGYGIVQAVQQLSDSRVRLRAGTLYAALDRLCLEGAIAVEREEVVDGRHRRSYRLTDAGRELLAGEVARLEANAQLARGRLAIKPSVGAS
jgi:DNA-binding PadR family transcriptional regulator